ncbi:MAG: exodeoxyribonuclease VII small subunit [Planctomycetes bacterium]|nr:exodeoxyribonuclease VII small subunit [Planctomycetota bacterium]
MAVKKKTDLTYAEAAAELDAILDEIESGTADVDELGEKVERAAVLIRFCREKLQSTTLRVNKVVEDLAALGTETEEADETEAET